MLKSGIQPVLEEFCPLKFVPGEVYKLKFVEKEFIPVFLGNDINTYSMSGRFTKRMA